MEITGKYKKREVSCKKCAKKFISQNSDRSYCSRKCASIALLKLRDCPGCGKQFPSDPQTKYCTVECGKTHRTYRRGIPLSDEWKHALSEGRKNSEKCKGSNLYNWKGGKSTEKERFRIHNNNRRSSLNLKIDRVFTLSLLLAQKNKCFYCDEELKNYKALDHLTSIKNSGDNQKHNLVWSCKSCNSRKRDKNLEDYAIKTGKLYLVDKWDNIFSSALLIEQNYYYKHAKSRI